MEEDNHLIFKFNSGLGAVLCSNCRKIICTGDRIPKYIWDEPSKSKLPPQFCCDECKHEYYKNNLNNEHI